MRITKLITLLAAAALAAAGPAAQAGSHTWSGGGANKLWSTPANWQNSSPPAVGEANVALVFPTVLAAARYSTNNISGLTINAVNIWGNGYKIGGLPVILGGFSAGFDCAGKTTNVWDVPIEFAARYISFGVAADGTFIVSGALSGSSGLTKTGPGLLRLSPELDNSFAGTTLVLEGELDLNGAGSLLTAVTIPGPLIVGQTNPPATSWPYVEFEQQNQIADDAQITIFENGFVRLNGFNDGIGSLVLQAGSFDTRNLANTLTGVLSLNGNVTCLSHQYAGVLRGQISLNGADRTFDVPAGSFLSTEAVVTHGVGVAGITKVGGGDMWLHGANVYNGFTKVNAGTLGVINNATLGTIANGTIVASNATLMVSDANLGSESIILNGKGVGGTNGALMLYGTNSMSGSVLLASDTVINTVTGTNYDTDFTLLGVLAGSAELTKMGQGTLRLGGLLDNTHSGATRVLQGSLELAKSAGHNAMTGPLIIGGDDWSLGFTQVRHRASHQIADSAPITVRYTGTLDLNNYFETVGPLSLNDGEVYTGSGLLTLNSNVSATVSPNNWWSVIGGHLSLGGVTRVFDVSNGSSNYASLYVGAAIVDGGNNAGIVKNGTGAMVLTSANSYNGLTTINSGVIKLISAGTPGSSAAGTIVNAGATLFLANSVINDEDLTLYGNGAILSDPSVGTAALFAGGTNLWSGPVTLADSTSFSGTEDISHLAISGAIGGLGGLTQKRGTLQLAGNTHNYYVGTTRVDGGTLLLNKTNAVAIPATLVVGDDAGGVNADVVRLQRPNQIQDLASVQVSASGLLDLNHQAETIGSLAGTGNVNLGLALLTTGGNNSNTEFSGGIGGVSVGTALVKEGTGSFTLSGTNTYTGKTVVNNGHLYVQGSQPQSGVVLNPNGQLHGQGTVGAITGLGGWALPGDNLLAPTHGCLKSGSLVLDAASDFNIHIAGMSEGSSYDQISVAGSVNLGNAALHLSSMYYGSAGNHFTIIKNDGVDPVTGTFASHPEGSSFLLNGAQFQISYHGGDGNDVVLTQITSTPGPSISIIKPETGNVQVSGTGLPGATYKVQANDDLNTTNWVSLGNIVAPAGGAISFIDTDASNHQQRFYRFLVAP